jgi:hypothetical protein
LAHFGTLWAEIRPGNWLKVSATNGSLAPIIHRATTLLLNCENCKTPKTTYKFSALSGQVSALMLNK